MDGWLGRLVGQIASRYMGKWVKVGNTGSKQTVAGAGKNEKNVESLHIVPGHTMKTSRDQFQTAKLKQ